MFACGRLTQLIAGDSTADRGSGPPVPDHDEHRWKTRRPSFLGRCSPALFRQENMSLVRGVAQDRSQSQLFMSHVGFHKFSQIAAACV